MDDSEQSPLPDSSPSATFGKTTRVGTIWVTAARWLQVILYLPVSAILARLLTPTEFGIVAAATFFTQLATRLTQFGLNSALVRLKTIRREHEASVFVFSILVNAGLFIGLQLAAPQLGRVFASGQTASALRLASYGFLLSPFGSVPAALIGRHLQYRQAAIIDFFMMLVTAVATLTFAWWGLGYNSPILGTLVGSAGTTVWRLMVTRWRPTLSFDRAAFAELFSFGAAVQTRRLLEYAAQNLDTLIVGRLLGLEALGYYDKAFSSANRLPLLILAGPTIVFRVFAVIQDDAPRFRRAFRKVILSVSLLVFPVLTGLAVVASDLFVVLYGAQWTAAVPAFRVLCVSSMCTAMYWYLGTILEASGQVWSQVWRQLLSVVVFVPAVAAGSLWGGPTGAAVGVLAANAVLTVLFGGLIARQTPATASDLSGALGPAILCSLALMAFEIPLGLLLVGRLPLESPVARLGVQGVCGGAFFAAYVLWSPFGRPREVLFETIEDFSPNLAKRLDVLTRRAIAQ
ncbi:MAG: lipopolysaccharide biosynthesis protein [Vicinamibacterales bacterium]